MRTALVILLAAALLAPTTAFAQLPDAIRSATLTRVQQDELNRRLTSMQQRFTGLARETQLREAAVRNIAVEIFGAQPDLDFQSYATLIDSGARQLRTYIGEARTRTESDPELAALRERAISAAEDGRLSDARRLYDELLAANRTARRRSRDAEDLADARDIAESAALAFTAADFEDAARRYADAAALAPQTAPERTLFLVRQAEALSEIGQRFVQPERLDQALAVLNTATPSDAESRAQVLNGVGVVYSIRAEQGNAGAADAAITTFREAVAARSAAPVASGLPPIRSNLAAVLATKEDEASWREAVALLHEVIASREASSTDWASAQANLVGPLMKLGDAGDDAALDEALAASDAALTVFTRTSMPWNWAGQQLNRGALLGVISEQRNRGDALVEAIGAYQSALEVYTRETAPLPWADVQYSMGVDLQTLGHRAGRPSALSLSVDALGHALEVYPEGSEMWARARTALGRSLYLKGRADDDPEVLRQSASAYRGVLEHFPPERSPASFVTLQQRLGDTLYWLGRSGDRPAEAEAVVAYRAAIGALPRAEDVERWADLQFALSTALRRAVVRGELQQLDAALEAARAAASAYEEAESPYAAEARDLVVDLEGRR